MNIIYNKDLIGKRFERLENGDSREIKAGKFVPEVGQYYWYLSSFGFITKEKNSDEYVDEWILKHSRVFRTREECEEYQHFLEVLDKYTFEPDWNDLNQEKWQLGFNYQAQKIWLAEDSCIQTGSVYFESDEECDAFVDEVGEEAVKRFMFDIWE